MYNNSLSANNKIINYNDLIDIFNAMNEEFTKCMKANDTETKVNQRIDYQYQKWTFKDSSSSYKMSINFEDDTQIHFDNFNNFITNFYRVIIFKNRYSIF